MTYHPTCGTDLAAAIDDPDGPPIIDCDVLRETYRGNPITVPPMTMPGGHKEVILRGINLWTNSPASEAAFDFLGPTGAVGCGVRLIGDGGRWRTNAERVARVRNATGFYAEDLDLVGANIGWEFGRTEGGQCEQIDLLGCAGSQIKFDCLLFNGGSFNAARVERFKFHHHLNPDDGETAYAMRVLDGAVYGSKVDLYGWQNDQESDPELADGNKGIKIHSAGNVSRSDVNIDAENGGAYLMKIEFPPITYPWEGDDPRRMMALDVDRISLSGTWPYAYGLILDGFLGSPEQWPTDGQGNPDPIEKWFDPGRVTVTGGHLRGYGKEANRLVAIVADGSIIYPAGVTPPA